ncbi:hypothetical protein [Zobellia uliginosa]|uniref:hypothetical protein n=1 Tax=Zobellia uliginosa TaxID=143224 RepID=UPI0026E183E8|nr:hypothetical protein [Zobellia uliginosa]MDO6519689.1 hypothetical protein [Zobellia uliginosa]
MTTGNTVQQLLKYFRFLTSATNQHGVHSPFVYAYVTKCLYKKKPYRTSKSMKVLLKSTAYFNVERIRFLGDDGLCKALVLENFPNIEMVSEAADIVFLPKNAPYGSVKDFLSHENAKHNDTMLFYDAPHGSPQNEAIWQALKAHRKVTVTIDMFYCGAVFFRREQAKEHFKIRI